MVTVNGNQSPEAVFMAIKQVLPLNGVRRTRSPMTYTPKVFHMRHDTGTMIVQEHAKAKRASPSKKKQAASSPSSTGSTTGTTDATSPSAPQPLTATLSGPPPLAASSSASHLSLHTVDDEQHEERIPEAKLDWSNALLAFNSVLLLAPAKEINRYVSY
jgi:hypothetical protein